MGAQQGQADADGWPAQDQDLSTMSDAVDGQVTMNEVVHTVNSLFGGQTGGKAIRTGEGGAGGYFKLEPDEIRHYEQRIQKVIDRARKLRRRIRDAREQLFQPAGDGPSGKQANAAKASFSAAEKHLAGIIAYGMDYHDKLARSVQDYEHIDQANADGAHNAANGGDAGRVV